MGPGSVSFIGRNAGAWLAVGFQDTGFKGCRYTASGDIMRLKTFAAFATIATTALFSFGTVKVEMKPAYPKTITRLAIAPLDCDDDLSCAKIERALTKSVRREFASQGIEIVGPDDLRQETSEQALVTAPNLGNVLETAAELGCDAVLFARVSSGGGLNQTMTTSNYLVGAGVRIDVLDLDGEVLMHGWASFPSHPWKQNQHNFAKVHFSTVAALDRILAESLD